MASSLLLQPPVSVAPKVRPATTPLRGPGNPFHGPLFLPLLSRSSPRQPFSSFISQAKGKVDSQDVSGSQKSNNASVPVADDEEEIEEDLPWIQEKAMDLVEFTGTVTQALPGPRVGQSKFPWILAIPLAYIGVSFVIAFVKTVKKFTSPRAQKRRLVNKNAMLLKSIDELLAQGENQLQYSALKGLMQKTDFSMEDVLRKYIRYSLNEKPFNPELVINLIRLRKASMLEDPQVADVLNELSRRIVKEKGPVVMDISGFTEKGFKRKLAVQALFAKILYLSELPDICSKDGSLMIKEIFGVTDEDADTLRIQTLSESGDVDLLEKMVDYGSEEKESPGQ